MANIWIDQSDDGIRDFGASDAAEPELIELVPAPVMPAQPRTRYTDRAVRPSSNFVAQLMAVERGYPQTRDVYRAEPDQATAAYRSAKAYQAGRTRRFS
ncbi:conserved hypothetical protein [Rhodopseudomonas palustris HaA2]|uniref:Uncharacterized protein n=1 Tax=Rhodopseudomonas palustris (strain HaA2) TaxID=316058 RepID=Q2J2T7_RHOP2|nr:hypothetical protein [Rhodopseudomonas palustris]ABD05223.1 conserved hypothetical protein [Rhodopseudomonas palustris HaA2]